MRSIVPWHFDSLLLLPCAQLTRDLLAVVIFFLKYKFDWWIDWLIESVYQPFAARACDGDRKIIDNNEMAAYTMKDVRQLGIEEVVKRAIQHVSPKYVRTF